MTRAVKAWMFVNMMLAPCAAYAQGLGKVKTKLETVKESFLSFAPTISVIILIILTVSYAFGFVEKGVFFKWGAAVIIIGSASQITNMLIS